MFLIIHFEGDKCTQEYRIKILVGSNEVHFGPSEGNVKIQNKTTYMKLFS